MPLFEAKKTNRHGHLAYIDPSGKGVTTTDRKHSHAIRPPQPHFPGDKSVATRGPEMEPAEDGHVHELAPYIGPGEDTPSTKGETDEAKVTEVRLLYKTAKEEEEEARDKAKESEDFYCGEQWDDDVKAKLEAERRACLTINEIEPKIDLLSGYQRQNRTDIKYLPVEAGDGRVADILNVFTSNIFDQCDYKFEETETFQDATVVGRGLFHVFVDRDKNIEGDIIVESFPWRDVYFGPHRRADIKDCEYLVKTNWFSQAKLEQLYPDKADEINAEWSLLYEEGDEDPHRTYAGDQYAAGEGALAISDPNRSIDPEFVDISRKEFRVLECWRKDYEKVTVAFKPEHDFYEKVSRSDKKRLEQLGIKTVDRNVERMRVMTVASGILLDDRYDELFNDCFPIIPVYAKKRGQMFWGKVEAVKDPQREINKRHSQFVDILNKVASYGWFFDDDTFPNASAQQEFTRKSSSPGFTQKVRSTKNPPLQVEGVKFPNEIMALEEVSSVKLREIMNINPELLGLNSKAESGVAQVEKKRQALIGNEFLFDNLDRAKKVLGKLVVKLIQRVPYSPERILRVIESQAQKGAVDVGGQPYDQSRRAEVMALLQAENLELYDVAVSEAAHSPTQRRANFVAWADLAGKGIQVPPSLLVELSDLEDKDKVIQAMQQQAEEAKKMEQMKIQAEVQKAQIASQAKTQGPPSR